MSLDVRPKPLPDPVPGGGAADFFEQAAESLHASDREALLRTREDVELRVRRLTEGREQLLLLLDVSRSLNSVRSTGDVLDRVMDSVITISGAERGFLVLLDSDGEPRLEKSRNLDQAGEAVEDTLRISQSILKQAIDSGRTVSVSDALSNPSFLNHQSVRDLSLRTVICLPLKIDQKVLGAIYLDSRTVTPVLAGDGLNLLEAFAAQAAVAIANARAHDSLKAFQARLEVENGSLRRALGSEFMFESIIGKSQAMNRVFAILERIVDTPVTVLINGETGTGKELVARALHASGPRRQAAFVPINCGALPEPLLESELFGYKRGAFTGAAEDRMGLFESAHGGTLFLDEIGEMPPALQVKMLRVLQDGEVRRVGEAHSRRVDVRIVAATNRDLAQEVEAGRFRQDLYYRLNVVTVTLPPLRDRPEDLLLLSDHFLAKFRAKLARPHLQFTSDARSCILNYAWPGNVRELEHAIERATALTDSDQVSSEHLVPGLPTAPLHEDGASLKQTLQRSERSAIEAALRRTGGNISRAATALGVSRQHLHNRIRKLGVASPR